MIKKIKEKQSILLHGSGMGAMGANANIHQCTQTILDQNVAQNLLQQLPLSEADKYLSEYKEQATGGGASATSFKQMKARALQKKQESKDVQEDAEMSHEDIIQKTQDQNTSSMMLDRVYKALHESCVVLEDFTQMPILRYHNGQIYFLTQQQAGSKRTTEEVVDSRQDYYALRLALAEERVFSHSDHFQRAKLSSAP